MNNNATDEDASLPQNTHAQLARGTHLTLKVLMSTLLSLCAFWGGWQAAVRFKCAKELNWERGTPQRMELQANVCRVCEFESVVAGD